METIKALIQGTTNDYGFYKVYYNKQNEVRFITTKGKIVVVNSLLHKYLFKQLNNK